MSSTSITFLKSGRDLWDVNISQCFSKASQGNCIPIDDFQDIQCCLLDTPHCCSQSIFRISIIASTCLMRSFVNVQWRDAVENRPYHTTTLHGFGNEIQFWFKYVSRNQHRLIDDEQLWNTSYFTFGYISVASVWALSTHPPPLFDISTMSFSTPVSLNFAERAFHPAITSSSLSYPQPCRWGKSEPPKDHALHSSPHWFVRYWMEKQHNTAFSFPFS